MDEARFQEAIATRESGDPAKAYEQLACLLKTTYERKEQAALLLNMANCKASLQKYDEAASLLTEARGLLPGGDRTPHLHADFLEAVILAASGDNQNAASHFERLIDNYGDLLAKPDERNLGIDARERLGFVLIKGRNFKRAISILEDLAAEGLGNQQRINLYLGIAHSFTGVNERAWSELSFALVGPDLETTIEALCRLGIIEYQNHRCEAARRFLERAIQEAPEISEWKAVALNYIARLPHLPSRKIM